MISKHLFTLFLISIPLFIAHGIEEYLTGFYKVDEILFGHLSPEIANPSFVVFQLFFWSLLIVVGFKYFNSKLTYKLMILTGVIYIFEAHHLIHTFFIEKAYYPGSITALGFPILAILFWKERFRRVKA